MNARNRIISVACVVAAFGLTACGRTVATPTTVAPDSSTPVSHAYYVESHELIEISHFADGSAKYTPTGWIVVSTGTSAAATTAASDQ